MKVAYLASRFPTIAETFILFEILELRRLGLDVSIYPLIHQREEAMHGEVEELRGSIHHIPLFSLRVARAQGYWLARRPLRYLGAWGRAILENFTSPGFLARTFAVIPLAACYARELSAAGVDHVHAHWATHPALAAFVIHRLTGLPYTFTIHAHDLYVDRHMLETKIREARSVVTISEYNRTFIEELYGRNAAAKTSVVRCGIDTEHFAPGSRPKPGGPFRILCIATLKDYKGHRYLIEACGILAGKGLDFRCTLVGEGPLRAEIEALIRAKGLEGNVVLAGFQPRQAVREMLQESGLMVLPSVVTETGKMEGIPVSLMEAMAMEVPVVATRISGISELVEDGVNGLLVRPGDSRELAAAALLIIETPPRAREMGRAGRETVLREYDLKKNAVSLLGIITGR